MHSRVPELGEIVSQGLADPQIGVLVSLKKVSWALPEMVPLFSWNQPRRAVISVQLEFTCAVALEMNLHNLRVICESIDGSAPQEGICVGTQGDLFPPLSLDGGVGFVLFVCSLFPFESTLNIILLRLNLSCHLESSLHPQLCPVQLSQC